MARSTILGFPRIGPARELERATEAHWAGRLDADELARVSRDLRADAWRRQAEAGLDLLPSNDFSSYDHVLDQACVVGALPERFAAVGHELDQATRFALARGRQDGDGTDVAPLEMTKWFDTNYHYLVPELGAATRFALRSTQPVDAFVEAQRAGLTTRPVLVGPITFLLLAKSVEQDLDPLELLPWLLPVYEELLARLGDAGAEWVQLDEPALASDLADDSRVAYEAAYEALARPGGPKVLLTTYFGGVVDEHPWLFDLPLDGIHLDLVRDPDQLATALDRLGPDQVLSAGIVDGRNVWRTDLRRALDALAPAADRLGDRLWVAPSCSLLHVPYDVAAEPDLDPHVRPWLAFAQQKLDEVVTLTRGLTEGVDAVADALAGNDEVLATRRTGGSRVRSAATRRATGTSEADARRDVPYAERRVAQAAAIPLPVLPTTTIGSFPQTAALRRARRDHVDGILDDDGYRAVCEAEIARVVAEQEALGLDVLVHGEPERNDMVQHFGERLDGIVTTRHGWVQSYGTRYVRPPIIHGDVARPRPMTVEWATYAQGLTDRPVKGMLTGPVTILQWSFVRDDQPRADTCRQIALAVRDEVADLQDAGIGVIQVDEPALREGLPLRSADHKTYLDWATECFRLATAVARPDVQVHTHMCYAEFADILDAVVALDADVISLEAARAAGWTCSSTSPTTATPPAPVPACGTSTPHRCPASTTSPAAFATLWPWSMSTSCG